MNEYVTEETTINEKQSNVDNLKEKDEKVSAKKEDFPKNKKGSIILDVLFYGTLVVLIILTFRFSRDESKHLEIGGYRLFEVLTSSMKSVYPKGCILLVKEVPPAELVIGDDITFLREDNNIITHRIIEVREDYEGTGQRGFVTKGVNNSTADRDIVLGHNVIGKVIQSIPNLGTVIGWISENIAIVVAFFLALIACSFSLKIFLRERSKEKSKRKNETDRDSEV